MGGWEGEREGGGFTALPWEELPYLWVVILMYLNQKTDHEHNICCGILKKELY